MRHSNSYSNSFSHSSKSSFEHHSFGHESHGRGHGYGHDSHGRGHGYGHHMHEQSGGCCPSGAENITLTINDDTITYPGYDGVCIKALDGNDVIKGTYGDDKILGQGGDDTLYGRSGIDYIDGGIGNDTLYGNLGDDTILGRSGDDFLHGGIGADTIKAGAGNDSITGDEHDLLIDGGTGFDTLSIKDLDGDLISDLDMSTSSVTNIEALIGIGNFTDSINATIDLEKILQESEDDSLSDTADTTNTFIAVQVDTLTIDSDNLWTESGQFQVTAQDLDQAAEDSYLEMIGITKSIDLNAYTFTKDDGETVTIITDIKLTDIYDADTGVAIDVI